MPPAPPSAALLAPGEPPAAELLNPEGAGPFIFACEHASRRLPAALGDLGLAAADRDSHIAWDPGARAVALRLGEVFDAPVLAQRYSRLVIDCNRPPGAPGSIVTESEARPVPGNAALSEHDQRLRAETVYAPFHAALEALIARRLAQRPQPILISVHSFTPVYRGVARDVELGILHDDADPRLADRLLARAAAITDLRVERNAPYGPRDGVMHTLQRHGVANGLLNAMFEIRNDLLHDEGSAARVADGLAELLRAALGADLGGDRRGGGTRRTESA
jgi:predicted N-formylglutamate amidohydrolase